jgi:hypothetical protein
MMIDGAGDCVCTRGKHGDKATRQQVDVYRLYTCFVVYLCISEMSQSGEFILCKLDL